MLLSYQDMRFVINGWVIEFVSKAKSLWARCARSMISYYAVVMYCINRSRCFHDATEEVLWRYNWSKIEYWHVVNTHFMNGETLVEKVNVYHLWPSVRITSVLVCMFLKLPKHHSTPFFDCVTFWRSYRLKNQRVHKGSERWHPKTVP